MLVDGWLVNPLPVEVCRELSAEKIIVVDLNCKGQNEPIKADGSSSVFPIIDETFRVVMTIAQK